MGYLRILMRTTAIFVTYFLFMWVGLALQVFLRFRGIKRRRHLARVIRQWARLSCWVFNIKIKIVGDASVFPGSLIVANHFGTPDIFVLGALFPAFFVSKVEIASWPLFSTMARLGEAIFTDRSRKHQVKEVMTMILRRLKEDQSVILFAEGKATDGRDVGAFMPSLFEGAVRAERPVVPVTLYYHDANEPSIACWGNTTFLQHILALLKFPQLEVTATIHPEISNEQDRRLLAERTRDVVREKLLQMQAGD